MDFGVAPDALVSRGTSIKQRSNPFNPDWPLSAWSCPYFSLKACPPKHYSDIKHTKGKAASPFNIDTPRKTRRDFGDPAHALDYLLREDEHTPAEDKSVSTREDTIQKPYTMSLTIFVGKKRVHKLAHIRNAIRKRLRLAVRHVVQDGIVLVRGNIFTRNASSAPAHHLLPRHRYLMQTSLELYRMPMEQLVPLVGEALRETYVSHPKIPGEIIKDLLIHLIRNLGRSISWTTCVRKSSPKHRTL